MFFLNQPPIRSANRIGACGLAFEQERGTVADLGDGGIDAEIPHRGGDQIVAGLEKGREVEELVAPMDQVAARRAVSHPVTVYKQNKAVIGADTYGITRRNRTHVEAMAKMENDRIAKRGSGMRDP